jgi:AmmeMemoRadiSam system protein B
MTSEIASASLYKPNGSHIDPYSIKVLFAPDAKFSSDDQLRSLYAPLKGASLDTVVFLETRLMDIPKKIPMPSMQSINTSKGEVVVNDLMRNEFCDEDDDFFIDDSAFSHDMEVLRHLPYLQDVLEDFKVLSVPICDDDPAIVREVDYVLSELLGGRNVLVIASCSMEGNSPFLDTMETMITTMDVSNLMNKVNSGECGLSGTASFLSGILLAKSWGLDLSFFKPSNNLESSVAGYALLAPKNS